MKESAHGGAGGEVGKTGRCVMRTGEVYLVIVGNSSRNLNLTLAMELREPLLLLLRNFLRQ